MFFSAGLSLKYLFGSVEGAHVNDWAAWALLGFLLLVALVVAPVAVPLFTRPYGRSHRVSGGVYVVLLGVGVWDVVSEGDVLAHRDVYDVLLPCVGVVLSLTAAHDFKDHKLVRNVASGVLDEKATVTASEMIEHSFYQLLNAVQALFLHVVSSQEHSLGTRMALYACVCAPWAARSWFPVNHFSDNYTKAGQDPYSFTSLLYRVKAKQYLLYKHALLHGLNVTCAVVGARGLTSNAFFRVYWLSLNAAYVFEFFLQTLVKRKHLAQTHMLLLNQWLMLVSTVAALQVLYNHVLWYAVLVSVGLNLIRRGREMSNLAALVAIVWVCECAREAS
jgi:hypothetical protein